jgi:hypothetical protein
VPGVRRPPSPTGRLSNNFLTRTADAVACATVLLAQIRPRYALRGVLCGTGIS